MGKWLERLSQIENTQIRHSQNQQKLVEHAKQSASEPFVSVTSTVIQKKVTYPSIWDVTLQTHGKLCNMVVIDPDCESETNFERGLVERFGIERLIAMKKRL